MTWIDIMPSLAQIFVVEGSPVRIRPGHEPVGWVEKNNQTLTVRGWGHRNKTHCIVIDENTGTSMSVPWDCLTIDLDHQLGFVSGMVAWQKLRLQACGKDGNFRDAYKKATAEDKMVLASGIVKYLNQTHREV